SQCVPSSTLGNVVVDASRTDASRSSRARPLHVPEFATRWRNASITFAARPTSTVQLTRATATGTGRRRPRWAGLIVLALVSLFAPTLVLDAPEVVANHLPDHSLSEQRSLLGRVSVVHSPVNARALDLL